MRSAGAAGWIERGWIAVSPRGQDRVQLTNRGRLLHIEGGLRHLDDGLDATRPMFDRRSVFASFALLAACSSESSPAIEDAPDGVVVADGGAAEAAPPAVVTPEAGVPVPPCDETKMASLQGALDGAADPKANVVLALKTPSCGYRFYSAGPSKPAETDLHRMASVTKTYVGGVILKLAEEGTVPLDSLASKWLDGIPGKDKVTVRHLLQHTSGLADFDDSLAWQAGILTSRKWKPQELADMAFKKGLQSEPGSKWAYANSNYVALGLLAEAATKQTITALIHKYVFDPLGAKASFLAGLETIEGKLAPGSSESGGDLTNRGDPSSWWVSGNVVAVPEDVVRWTEARGSGQFHSVEMQAEMLKTVPVGSDGSGYGLALETLGANQTTGGGPGIGHSGALPGYYNWSMYFPEHRTTLVAISDADPVKNAGLVLKAAMKTMFAPPM